MHRAFAAGVRFRIGPPQIERYLSSIRRLGRPFHDGPGHADLIDILKPLTIGHGARPASTDCDQRTASVLCCCNASYCVRVAWTAGDQRNGGAAMQPRPCISGVSDAGLMAHIDDAHTGSRGRDKRIVQVIAHQSEDFVYAKIAQSVYEQLRASGHATTLSTCVYTLHRSPRKNPINVCPLAAARSTARLDGAETAAMIGIRAPSAF